MATAFNRKKRVNPLDNEFKFGWCSGPHGSVLQHQPLGPDENPVDPVDSEGKRIPGFCPGSIVQSSDTARIKKGAVTYCQCSCHGDDRPEAYPGYFAYRAQLAGEPVEVEEEENESTADAMTLHLVEDTELPPTIDPVSGKQNELLPGGQFYEPAAPLLGVVQEPPLPQMGNPSEEESETVQNAPASAGTPAWTDDGIERADVKEFKYPNGSVVKTERQSVTRQGKEVTLVEWYAKLPDGTKVGSMQWSRKAAKELLP